MPVITVARQYGSLGDEIARETAERLRLRLVDQEIIDEVASRLGVPPSAITERDEREGGLVAELVRSMRHLYPASFGSQVAASGGGEVEEAAYLEMTCQVIREAARSKDAVILGRGGAFVLKEQPDVLNVLLLAPLKFRVEQVMATDGIDEHQAMQRIRDVDANRSRYVSHFFRAKWLQSTHYDLVLNSAFFGKERATSLLCQAAGAN